jgi:Spy/CpxP family protein refolding chaperone
MRSMTRLAFGAVLAAGLVLAPQAGAQSEQQGRPDRGGQGSERINPQQRLERRMAMLTERLQLSQQQATQIRQIMMQEQTQTQALWQKVEDGASRESLRPEMQSIRQRTEQQIEAVLTEQQRATYRELRESMRRGREERRGEGPPRNG